MASRVLGALAVTATAALATLALATPASAHTPRWNAYCDEGAKVTKLSVNLSAYVDRGKNTVVVKDGKTELLNKTFGNGYSQNWNDLDATVQHKFSIKVTTWDGYNFSEEKTVEPCVKKSPPKPEQPKPEQPKPEQPKPEQPKPEEPKPEEPKPPVETTPEAPSSSVTPPAPAPGGSTPEPPLAATGASPLWLLLSGLGLVGAGAGTLLFLRRRRSA